MKTRTSDGKSGRLDRRAQEVGPVTPEMIEQKSRELAKLSGRDPANVTEEDRLKALHALYDEEQSYEKATPQVVYQAIGNPADPKVVVEVGMDVKA